MVIGFSQVGSPNGGWYVAGSGSVSDFEHITGDANWQLLWKSDGGVDEWKNPNYAGWNSTLKPACLTGSSSPERIIISISGSYGAKVSAWVDDIDSVVTTIRFKYPLVQEIILQPVVGGPAHLTCYEMGDSIRASWQHKYIDSAIAIVAGLDTLVSELCSPEVSSCNDYADMVGHLEPSIAHIIGAEIGQCYVSAMGITSVQNSDYELNIYPNPSDGKFIIQAADQINEQAISIYNYLGEQVWRSHVRGNYDLRGLPDGVYIIRLGEGKDTRSGKIIIWE